MRRPLADCPRELISSETAEHKGLVTLMTGCLTSCNEQQKRLDAWRAGPLDSPAPHWSWPRPVCSHDTLGKIIDALSVCSESEWKAAQVERVWERPAVELLKFTARPPTFHRAVWQCPTSVYASCTFTHRARVEPDTTQTACSPTDQVNHARVFVSWLDHMVKLALPQSLGCLQRRLRK